MAHRNASEQQASTFTGRGLSAIHSLVTLVGGDHAAVMKLSMGLIDEATNMVRQPLNKLASLGEELQTARDDETKQRILKDAKAAVKKLNRMAEEVSAMIGSATL